MASKQPDLADLNALAIEACDMWQEHLSTFAKDPSARAELTRFLEPQRRLFADWASMMQQGVKQDVNDETSAPRPSSEPVREPTYRESSFSPEAHSASSHSATQSGAAHGDDSLRVAQLALRVAELEKRLSLLEHQIVSAARRSQRTSS